MVLVGVREVSRFSLFSTLFFSLSPKCPHLFTQTMTYFPFSQSYLILSFYFTSILSSHLVISDDKGQPSLFGILGDSYP